MTSLRRFGGCLHIAIGVLVAAASARAQSAPVIFQGLAHTPVGAATLRLDGDALDVGTMGAAGEDGVATQLGSATSWTARVQATAYGTLPLSLDVHAIADGKRISTASVRQSGGNLRVSALFTGSTTYSAQVYDDGRLVGSMTGLPPTASIGVPPSFCKAFWPAIVCEIAFRNTHNSVCEYDVFSESKATLTLPNGVTLTGNELRLVEEVKPAGHYPYLTFDGMVMQSNAYSLLLLSESAR